MAQALEWIVALRDSVTGPATAAKNAVDALRLGIQRTVSAARQKIGLGATAASVGGGVTRADGRLRDATTGRFMKGASGGMGELGSKSDAAAGSLAKVAASTSMLVGMKLAEWALAGARAMSGLVWDGMKFAVDSASFKRNMLASLELLEGSAAKARETFSRINAIADTTPFETQKVMDMFKSLRSAGMNQGAAEKMFMALSDISSVQGKDKDEILERLKAAVIKIKGVGKLDMETLLQLSEAGSGAGINVESILKAVAAKRGVSMEAAKAALSSGQIKWEEAFGALQAATVATVNKGKELGTATKIFGTGSWEGALSTLKSKLDDIFSDINISPLIKGVQTLAGMLDFSAATGTLTPLKKAMLDLKATTERFFNGLFQKFGRLTSEASLTEMLTRLVPVIDAVAQGISDVIDAAVAMAMAFDAGFQQAFKFDNALGGKSLLTLQDLVGLANVVGQVLGGISGLVLSLLTNIADGWASIFEGAGPAIDDLYALMNSGESTYQIFGGLRDLVKGFASVMSSVLGPALSVVIIIIGGLWDAIGGFVGALRPMIDMIMSWAGETTAADGSTRGLTGAAYGMVTAAQYLAIVLGFIGKVLGYIVGGFLAVIAAVLMANAVFWEFIIGIGFMIAEFGIKAFWIAISIGTAIVKGIWEGIKASWAWLSAGVGNLVSSLPGMGGADVKAKPNPMASTIAPATPSGQFAPTQVANVANAGGVDQTNTFSVQIPITVSATGDAGSVAGAVQQGAQRAAPGVADAFAALASQAGV